jgi:hypothetical protein
MSEYEEYLALMERKQVEEVKLQRAAHERRQLGIERREMAVEDDCAHEFGDALRTTEAAEVRRLETKLKHYWDTRYEYPRCSCTKLTAFFEACLHHPTNSRGLASTIFLKTPDKFAGSTSTRRRYKTETRPSPPSDFCVL